MKYIYIHMQRRDLNQQSFNLVFDRVDLRFDWRRVVGGDGSSNNWSGNTTSSTQSNSGWNKNVWNVFIFTQQWQVQQNFNWFTISGHDDKFGNTPVQSLGGFVSTFFQLSQVGSLLNNTQNLFTQSRVSQWKSFWVWSSRHVLVWGL